MPALPRTGLLATALLVLGSGILAQNVASDPKRLPLDGYFEPSGVVQLEDGRLVLVEDEKTTAVSVLKFTGAMGFSGQPLVLDTLSLPRLDKTTDRTGTGAERLDDLEAVTQGSNGYVYAITSHSRTQAGNRQKKREKLVRFRLDGDRAVDTALVLGLRDQMAALHPEIARAAEILDSRDNDHLNVEGLAWDRAGKRLLIGMRGPVIDRLSVILALPDLQAVFDGTRPVRLADELILLDLDRGGIRAMEFDPKLNGFLILSRREKRGKGFKLWLWGGSRDQPPRRILLPEDIDLSKAEGITPVRREQRDQIMIVFDTGQKSRGREGEYLFLPYDQLDIQPPRPRRD